MFKYFQIGINLMLLTLISLQVKQGPMPNPRGANELWQVIAVADGDTITVKKDGEIRKIRLCGVDAPETAHRRNEISQPGGEAAKRKLSELIQDAGGLVEVDFIEQDRYGRWVGEIFTHNPQSETIYYLNAKLVELGLAYPYKKYWGNCPHRKDIQAAELKAINPIWDDPDAVPPEQWRRSHQG